MPSLPRVQRRFAITSLIFAWICANGAVWDAVQVFAWARMFAGYAHTLPVRAAFAYGKKKGRREYVRVTLKRAADGTIEAEKYPQDGAGVLTSLTETDGLVELDEGVTTIERGASVGFLPFSVLSG